MEGDSNGVAYYIMFRYITIGDILFIDIFFKMAGNTIIDIDVCGIDKLYNGFDSIFEYDGKWDDVEIFWGSEGLFLYKCGGECVYFIIVNVYDREIS